MFRAGDDLSGHDPNPFFVRANDGRFYDVAAKIGIDAREVRRAIAVGDVDGDGRLDFAVANQWAPSAVYVNRAPTRNFSLSLSLWLLVDQKPGQQSSVHFGGAAPNARARAAIGASVEIGRRPFDDPVARANDHRARIAYVDGGSGHSGACSTEVHFGLGTEKMKFPIEIRWRDAFGQPHTKSFDLAAGRYAIYLGAESGP
jgi:hypothetical protein